MAECFQQVQSAECSLHVQMAECFQQVQSAECSLHVQTADMFGWLTVETVQSLSRVTSKIMSVQTV
jgi:hypothetical protein